MKFVESYKAGRISLDDARRYALKVLENYPQDVDYYLTEGIITLEEARPIALKVLERNPWRVFHFFKAGIITREEAKPIAFKILENRPEWVDYIFKAGIITQDEARPYALEALENNPKAFTPDFRELVNFKKYSSPVLNQLDREGVDVESMIDPELRHLLDSLK